MAQPTLLANTWVVAHLPTKYKALLYAAGSAGEAAFHNSLDEQFAEAGYCHMPTILHHRRQPTYFVVGTTTNEEGVSKTVQHLAPSLPDYGRRCPLFCRARVHTNATIASLNLKAIAIDMSPSVSVRTLASFFMSGFTNLASIHLPPTIEKFENGSFYGCTGLRTIDMSQLVKVRALPSFFMSGCTSLTSIQLPLNVKLIGNAVFNGCTSLDAIDMSMLVGVTKLPTSFMSGCTRLKSVRLPPHIEEVEGNVFHGCTSLREINSVPCLCMMEFVTGVTCECILCEVASRRGSA